MIRPKRQAHRFGAPSRQKRLIAAVLTGLGCIALYTAVTHRSVAATTAKLGLEDATDRAVGGLAGADAAHGQTDTMTGGEHEHEHDAAELVSDEAPAVPESARLDELEKGGAAGNDSGSAGYVQPPPVHPVSGKPVRAEIITCPACRLNSLPHVKHFVKKVATYFTPGLVVTYISGEDPRLHLYEDDKEVDDVDLTLYDSAKIMKRLAAFGIHPKVMTNEIKEGIAAVEAPVTTAAQTIVANGFV